MQPPPSATYQIIHLHPDAPAKPAVGAACNGCGVCCTIAPCPIGVLVTGRRHGRCAALVWQDTRHVCGLLAEPAWAARPGLATLSRWTRAIAARSIAAGVGCDAKVTVADPPPFDPAFPPSEGAFHVGGAA